MAFRAIHLSSETLQRLSAISRSSSVSFRVFSRSYAVAARLRNEAIPHKYVRLVDRTTGQLTPMRPLRIVLAGRKAEGKKVKEAVELVQSQPEPIVKYVDISTEYWKQREQRKQQILRGKATKEKEIQMTWAVSEADLAHKLKGARQALEQGQKVYIVYTGKKGQTRPTVADMQAKMEATVQMLNDVGKESKKPSVVPPSTGLIHLEPI